MEGSLLDLSNWGAVLKSFKQAVYQKDKSQVKPIHHNPLGQIHRNQVKPVVYGSMDQMKPYNPISKSLENQVKPTSNPLDQIKSAPQNPLGQVLWNQVKPVVYNTMDQTKPAPYNPMSKSLGNQVKPSYDTSNRIKPAPCTSSEDPCMPFECSVHCAPDPTPLQGLSSLNTVNQQSKAPEVNVQKQKVPLILDQSSPHLIPISKEQYHANRMDGNSNYIAIQSEEIENVAPTSKKEDTLASGCDKQDLDKIVASRGQIVSSKPNEDLKFEFMEGTLYELNQMYSDCQGTGNFTQTDWNGNYKSTTNRQISGPITVSQVEHLTSVVTGQPNINNESNKYLPAISVRHLLSVKRTHERTFISEAPQTTKSTPTKPVLEFPNMTKEAEINFSPQITSVFSVHPDLKSCDPQYQMPIPHDQKPCDPAPSDFKLNDPSQSDSAPCGLKFSDPAPSGPKPCDLNSSMPALGKFIPQDHTPHVPLPGEGKSEFTISTPPGSQLDTPLAPELEFPSLTKQEGSFLELLASPCPVTEEEGPPDTKPYVPQSQSIKPRAVEPDNHELQASLPRNLQSQHTKPGDAKLCDVTSTITKSFDPVPYTLNVVPSACPKGGLALRIKVQKSNNCPTSKTVNNSAVLPLVANSNAMQPKVALFDFNTAGTIQVGTGLPAPLVGATSAPLLSAPHSKFRRILPAPASQAGGNGEAPADRLTVSRLPMPQASNLVSICGLPVLKVPTSAEPMVIKVPNSSASIVQVPCMSNVDSTITSIDVSEDPHVTPVSTPGLQLDDEFTSPSEDSSEPKLTDHICDVSSIATTSLSSDSTATVSMATDTITTNTTFANAKATDDKSSDATSARAARKRKSPSETDQTINKAKKAVHLPTDAKSAKCYIPDAKKCNKCDYCSASFELYSHLLSHVKRKHGVWKCTLCDAVYDLKVELSQHMSTQHGDWKCKQCSQRFIEGWELIKHCRDKQCKEQDKSGVIESIQTGQDVNKVHSSTEKNPSELGKIGEKKSDSSPISTGEGLDNRPKNGDTGSPQILGALNEGDQLPPRSDPQPAGKGKYKPKDKFCEQCGVRVKYWQSVNVHINCTECDAIFHGKWELNKHIKEKHGQLWCQICKTSFQDSLEVELHYLNKHGKEPPKPKQPKQFRMAQMDIKTCKICGKEVKGKYLLLTHMKIHKEKSISCTSCERKFHTQAEVDSHMKTSHGPAALVYNIECDKCKNRFPSKTRLKQHMKMFHLELKCMFCEERFIGTQPRNNHLRDNHKDKATHKCLVCDTACFTARLLRVHVINAHEKSKCNDCNEIFEGTYKLGRHRKEIHLKVKYKGEQMKKCYIEGCEWEGLGRTKLNTHLFYVSLPAQYSYNVLIIQIIFMLIKPIGLCGSLNCKQMSFLSCTYY